MNRRHHLTGMLVMMLSTAALGCEPRDEARPEGDGESIARAIAVLHPSEGYEARGAVMFERAAAGIAVAADLEGLEPGDHGFHIHEFGNCSAADATSAGGHFNPEGSPHGGPDDRQRHVGDLGNATASVAGTVDYERTDGRIAFEGAHSIIGRAVIVHAGEDDLASQPSGAAGARVACGVIGIAEVTAGM